MSDYAQRVLSDLTEVEFFGDRLSLKRGGLEFELSVEEVQALYVWIQDLAWTELEE